VRTVKGSVVLCGRSGKVAVQASVVTGASAGETQLNFAVNDARAAGQGRARSRPAERTGGCPPATVELGFETTEDLTQLVERLRGAGYTDAVVAEHHGLVRVQVTDPDGQRLEIHPAA
jgi:hypothetical protein